jgi:hypothetical protein
MGMMVVLLGVGLLAGGIMARHFILVAGGGALGVKTPSFWTCDGGALA